MKFDFRELQISMAADFWENSLKKIHRWVFGRWIWKFDFKIHIFALILLHLLLWVTKYIRNEHDMNNKEGMRKILKCSSECPKFVGILWDESIIKHSWQIHRRNSNWFHHFMPMLTTSREDTTIPKISSQLPKKLRKFSS